MYATTKELLITPPAVEPVSVAEARLHCRVPDTYREDDAYLATLIVAARQLLEEQCWSAFVNQTWDYWWDRFHYQMFIPRCAFASVAETEGMPWPVDAFQYVPADAESLTDLSTSIWEVSSKNQLTFVRTKYLQSWPSIRGHQDDVKMRVTIGYGATAASVPMPIRHAIKLLVGHWYSNREEEVSFIPNRLRNGVDALIGPYRLKDQ